MATDISWWSLSKEIGGSRDQGKFLEDQLNARLNEFLQKKSSKAGGIEQSADADKFFADVQAFFDKNYSLSTSLRTKLQKYQSQYNLQKDPSTIQKIFGGPYKEAKVLSGTWLGADKGWDTKYNYQQEQAIRSQALQNALGEEIFNIGLKDETGNTIEPTKLIDFAEYTPLTSEEKELTQSGQYNPLKNRKEELHALTTGIKKSETGTDTREMLKKAGKMPINGLSAALGSAGGTSEMQSSFDRIANKGAAQNAMNERIEQFKDKQEATTKLAKFKTEMLSADLKRKEELMKQKSKTAVAFAGSELTAAEHAAQLAKASL